MVECMIDNHKVSSSTLLRPKINESSHPIKKRIYICVCVSLNLHKVLYKRK